MVKFREYVLSSGRVVFGGRTAENNDELVEIARPTETLLHTAEPGSPFVNVVESPSKDEIKEAAIFCAKYSQAWRDNKQDVIVNKFLKSDMNKSPKMKAGTWSVKKQETVKVKKGDILKFEEKNGTQRAQEPFSNKS
jgi:predicted ribosome quality control (RQC) complex YloA/Tae2 family protein